MILRRNPRQPRRGPREGEGGVCAEAGVVGRGRAARAVAAVVLVLVPVLVLVLDRRKRNIFCKTSNETMGIWGSKG